jgi:hypothetical protein
METIFLHLGNIKVHYDSPSLIRMNLVNLREKSHKADE